MHCIASDRKSNVGMCPGRGLGLATLLDNVNINASPKYGTASQQIDYHLD